MLATKGSAGVAPEVIHSEDLVTNHVVIGEENHPGFETSDMVRSIRFSVPFTIGFSLNEANVYHCFALNEANVKYVRVLTIK